MPNDFFYNIFIELLGAFLVLIFAYFWGDRIEPFLKSLFYNGYKIEGNWKVEQISSILPDGQTLSVSRDILINLKQKANKIEGDATSVISGTNNDFIAYSVSGQIKDRFVFIQFEVKDKSKIAISSFLLEVVRNGSILEGYRTFYGFKKKKILSIACQWNRVT